MKKTISAFVLLLVLSFSLFAEEGHTHTGGGKSCAPNQTTCFVNPDDEPVFDIPFYKEYLKFLTKIFS